MESYRILYRIRAEHGYFGGAPCPALQCRLTPRGAALARRRGLLFRQTAPGEWTLLFCQEPDTANDVLTLHLSIADAQFALYTAWDGFRPSAAYRLELPVSDGTVDAAAIRPTGGRRAIGTGFCTLSLPLTDGIVRAASEGRPVQAVLHFAEASAQWEYLFIPRDEDITPPGRLQLEDAAGEVRFTDFRECEAYGRKAWLTRSEESIPLRRSYPCRLRLTAQNGGRQKRVLLAQVAPPEPGRYMDAPKGVIRQICLY